MKGCHSCEFKAAVDAGKFRNVAWEQVPCASCKLATGGFAVEYDEDRLDPDTQAATAKPEEGLREELPVEVMGQFVAGLLSLPSELRDVVAMRYRGMKYDEIAKVQKVTMACVEKRHRRAMELWPALREMFPEKIAKVKRRKKATSLRMREAG